MVQIALPSVLYFYNRSETSSECMRVKVQPSFSQEDMLNEVTTGLPRGKAVWLTLPLSQMAADAALVCWTQFILYISNHRSNSKANCWHGNYIRTLINANCCLKCIRQKDNETPPRISNDRVLWKIPGRFLHHFPACRSWQRRILAQCLCN